MATNYKADSKKSRNFTEKYIKAIFDWYGVNVVSTENHRTAFETALDRKHGVDLFGINTKGEPLTVAARTITIDKERGKDYPFSSIRSDRHSGNKTELQKWQDGELYATLNAHAVIDVARQVAVVVFVESAALFKYFKEHAADLREKFCNDNTSFKLASWRGMIENGVKLFGYRVNGSGTVEEIPDEKLAAMTDETFKGGLI